MHSTRNCNVACNVKIENENSWPMSSIPWQVPRFANNRQSELADNLWIDMGAWFTPLQQASITRVIRTIVSDVVEISICAAYRNVERVAGCHTKNRSQFETSQQV